MNNMEETSVQQLNEEREKLEKLKSGIQKAEKKLEALIHEKARAPE